MHPVGGMIAGRGNVPSGHYKDIAGNDHICGIDYESTIVGATMKTDKFSPCLIICQCRLQEMVHVTRTTNKYSVGNFWYLYLEF